MRYLILCIMFLNLSCEKPLKAVKVRPVSGSDFEDIPDSLKNPKKETPKLSTSELYEQYLNNFGLREELLFLSNITSKSFSLKGIDSVGSYHVELYPGTEFDSNFNFRSDFAVILYDQIFDINFAESYLERFSQMVDSAVQNCDKTPPYGLYDSMGEYIRVVEDGEGGFGVIDDNSDFIEVGYLDPQTACLHYTVFKISSEYVHHLLVDNYPPIKSVHFFKELNTQDQIYTNGNFVFKSLHSKNLEYICDSRNFYSNSITKDRYCY